MLHCTYRAGGTREHSYNQCAGTQRQQDLLQAVSIIHPSPATIRVEFLALKAIKLSTAELELAMGGHRRDFVYQVYDNTGWNTVILVRNYSTVLPPVL